MAGYTRQSSASIQPTETIKAGPINAELNKVEDAFALATGHKHDGSSDEGNYVPLIADPDANNKVAVDTSNNRVGVFVEVAAAPVEQIRVQDGVILPVTDDDVDLGSTLNEFKNLYLDGIANIDSLVADTADINGGSIDGAIIGASSAAAGSFTTVSTSGQGTFASVDINSGTIDGTTIGTTTPNTITGTVITASTNFIGAITGAVTGNVNGNLTGDVTGNVTGNLTGSVTDASGSSSFNNVTINGSLDMNAGTSATITNLSAPVGANDAATKTYVDTAVANLVDSAPGTLDTLNELAAALGDDPNFSTTITNEIATKLPLAGGTMSGAIAMGTSKITGLGDPTAAQDAATKTYVDTADATKLNLSGGTMTGNITMGANVITSTTTPTTDDMLTRKGYVDTILGSATDAATSASNALASEIAASTSETNAGNSASAALASENAAAASYDSFDDRYLGPKASAPTLDNDGDALLTGALYFNTTDNELYVWNGSAWQQGTLTAGSFLTVDGTVDATLGNIVVANGSTYINSEDSTDAVQMPAGTTAQRPTPVNGMIRYNSDNAEFEGYIAGAWGSIGGGLEEQTATTTSTSQTAIATYAAATYIGLELTVLATDTVATERTITKFLVTHDGVTAFSTEYGGVSSATAVATYAVDINGGNIRVLATAASTNNTAYSVKAVSFE